MPGRALVDRAPDAGADAGERVELLDGGVRAVHDDSSRVPERTERVRARRALAPEALGEIAVRRRVAELHRARDPDLREATHVLRREALCMLDPLAQATRHPFVPRPLEGVKRLAVRAVADCMDGDRPAGVCGASDDVLELLAARDANSG